MDPVAALRQIAFYKERAGDGPRRVRVFRKATHTVAVRRRGAVAVSAGLFLGALNMAAVAHATPDSGTAAGGTATSAASPGPTAGGGRQIGRGTSTAPARRDGSVRPSRTLPAAAQSARRARTAAEPVESVQVPALEPSLAVGPPAVLGNPSVPEPLSAPAATPMKQSNSAPRPPILAAAAPLRAARAADSMAQGSISPLPAALGWTMLAAARNDLGRREPVGQVVSPLGTPEQIAAESIAMRTTHTLPMMAMKGVLGLAWRIIGAIEYSQVGGPDKDNRASLRNAVDEWAMGAAFQSLILNSNEPAIVMQVAPPHRWYGQDVTGSRILYDNPDTIYRFVGVNYASDYVITGHLPDNDPQVSFSVLAGTTGTTVAVLDASQLELSPDRTFVLTVSGDPARPGQANHLQITPDTTLIAIRDTLSDWNTQDPMSLAIHRTAGPPNSLFSQFGGFAILGSFVTRSPALTALVSLIPPLPAVPPIVRGSVAALLMLRGISEESKYINVATTDPVTGKPKAPNVFTDPTSSASFLATQVQSAGYFQLADDEALVLTIRPNKAGYFVAPVTNDWTITDNYWDEQTSLNNTQARSNPDGSYTLVVSKSEPTMGEGTSVWNWVSTGGLNQGTMAIRFQSLDPDNTLNPTVSSQVVAISELPAVLPAGTVVVTPAERAAQIALRRDGFNRRFAPYPQAMTG